MPDPLAAAIADGGGCASFANVWRGAPAPFYPRWRSGVILRSNLMSGAKMDFCHFAQRIWTAHFDQLFCGLFHARGYAASQAHAYFFAFAFEPINESLTRHDRCRRDRNVGFRFR